jgi:hypothetical protein
MDLRKRQDAGNGKKKHWISLCGELDFEEATGLSYARQQNE